MAAEYQAVNHPRTGALATYRRLADGAYVAPPESALDNRDSIALAAYIADGGEIAPPEPAPARAPAPGEKAAAMVVAARTALGGAGTLEQLKDVLAATLDALAALASQEAP